MTQLVLGLVLFLGIHSVRIAADDWRQQRRNTLAKAAWKGTYSLISVEGFALVVWAPPVATRHAASLLTAAYVPRNALKQRLKHPVVLSVKVWALAHLLCARSGCDTAHGSR